MKLAQNVAQIQTTCLLILTGVAIGGALWWLSGVLIPFVLAVLLSLCLAPVMRFLMHRLRLPQPLAVAGSLFAVLLVLTGFGLVLTATAAQLSANIRNYEKQITALVEKAKTSPLLRSFVKPLESPPAKSTKPPDQQPPVDQAPQPLDEPRPFELQDLLESHSVGQFLLGLMNAVSGVLSQAVIVLLYLLFLLLGQQPGGDGGGALWRAVKQRIRSYLLLKGSISVATGVLVGGVLTVFGIDLALAFGVFAFLLNFVPSVGSIIATLLPVPVVLMTDQISTTTKILAIAVPGVIQFVVGNIVEPKLMGDSLDLHPVTVLLALIFWGLLWGLIGVLLAVPLTAAVKICLEQLDTTAPVARLMAGRGVPSPP